MPAAARLAYDPEVLTATDPPLLFIHVPKTGGSSMTALLRSLLPDAQVHSVVQHITLEEALAWKPELADGFVFGIVRNPWARIVSWWTMIRSSAERAADGSVEDQRYFRRLPMWQAVRDAADFDDFVIRVCPQFPRLHRPQAAYLWAPSRGPDYVGRTEALDEATAEVLARLGLPPSNLPRVNASKHDHYRSYYTDRSRQHVEHMYARDVEAFGYAF